MLTPNPRAAAPRRLSALTLLSLLLNLLPAPPAARAVAAPAQAAAGSFVRVLNLPTNDLVYDRQTQKIFASVPSSAGASGNSVTEVDPLAGSVGPSVFVGSEPNKLALSDDGQALYVGLDGALAFRRFDVPTRTAGQHVPLGVGQESGAFAPGDIVVSPAGRDTVAVARVRPSGSISGAGVVVYDNGVRRPTAPSGSNSINELAFSATEATLYGSSTSGGNLVTLGVNASGVTSGPTTSFTVGGEIQFAGGRIYSSTGKVVNVNTNELAGTFLGVNAGSPFAVDATAGRAYYLLNSSTTLNQTLTLRAYDLSTFVVLGETTVGGVNGKPSSLVRWGSNGLAFRTSGGQLFLVQTSLVPSTDAVPAPTPTPAATPTPTPASAEANVRHLLLPTKDLVYVPSSQGIYASLPSRAGVAGNSVARIEPETGAVGTPVFVGSEPNRLALSDDGHTLYVGLDGASSVRRFDTQTQTAGSQFYLGVAPSNPISNGPYTAADLAAMPGSPGTVAVCRLAGTINPSTSLSVYDEGVKRPDDSNVACRDIEFSSSPARIYSSSLGLGGFVSLNAVSASGVAFESTIGGSGGGFIKYADGLLYTANGSVFEPETRELKGTFAIGETGSNRVLLTVDTALGRAYFFVLPSGGRARLKVFDLNTFLPLGETPVELLAAPSDGSQFEYSSLVRWGTNGLALRTNSQVILIRSSLVGPGASPAPTPTPSPSPTPSPTPQPATLVKRIDLPVKDVVYSPATQKLYAAISSTAVAERRNSITAVDPLTGELGASVVVGTEPATLGVSDDGKVIYVGFDGAGLFNGPAGARRFDVAAQTVEPLFSLGQSPNGGGALYPYDFAVQPGNNEVVAVSRYSAGSPPQQGVAVFENGVQRPNTSPGHTEGSTHVAFSESPSKLYGGSSETGLKTMTVDASGVTVNATTPIVFGPGIEYRNGILYASSGQVYNPSTGMLVGRFNSSVSSRAMTVDAALGRAFFAEGHGTGNPMTITAYDTTTFAPVGTLTLPFTGTPSRLVRWGTNGLALRAAVETFPGIESKLYIIQSALVSSAAPIPTGVQFAATGLSVSESTSSAVVTVLRTGDLSQETSVDYTTADGTASERSDYTTAVGTLRFAPGESQKTVRVLFTNDAYEEGDETLSVVLGNPVGAQLVAPADFVVTIPANDSPQSEFQPSDDTAFFVRQHYRDFLGRIADEGSFFWMNEIDQCGEDAQCREVKRVNVSAAFFLSIEFQETGYLAYRLHQTAFGTGETLAMRAFLKDTQEIGSGVVVGQGAWREQLETNKRAFLTRFVARPEFAAAYPSTLTAAQYVDALNSRTKDPAQSTSGGALTQGERDQLVAELASGAKTRADVLRAVAENELFRRRQFNRAFVYMQYVGYLRRNPNATPDTDYAGYNFWLGKLTEFGGNYIDAEMVKAFITSIEYRKRFAP